MLSYKQVTDNLDLKILYELDRNTRSSYSEIAKKVNVSKQTVKQRLDRLISEGIISQLITIINMAKFGVIPNQVYLSLHSSSDEKKKELLDYITKLNYVAQVAECEGVFDIFFGLTGKNLHEINEWVAKIYTKFSHLIKSKKLVQLIDTRLFPRDYLIDKSRDIIPLDRGFHSPKKSKPEKLKKLDMQILAILSLSPRTSFVEIARKLKVTPQTIINRVKYLEKNNIIIGYLYLTNGEIFIQHNLLLELSTIPKELENKLFQYFASQPNVVFVVKLMGEYHFSITTECKNFEEYRKFIDEFKKEFGHYFKSFIPLFVKKYHKLNFLPPEFTI